MNKVTIEQSLCIAGILLLAKESGEAVEKDTLQYLEDTYPVEAVEVVLVMLETLTNFLQTGGTDKMSENPLPNVIDGIFKGFK